MMTQKPSEPSIQAVQLTALADTMRRGLEFWYGEALRLSCELDRAHAEIARLNKVGSE